MKRLIFTVSGLAAFGGLVLYFARNLDQGTYQIGYGPGFYPRVLVITLFVLLAVLFVQEWRAAGKEEEEESTKEKVKFNDIKLPLIFLGMIAAYAFLLTYIGFIADTFVFLLTGMLILKAKPLWSLLISAGITIALYYAFGVLLMVQLPRGLLFGG